MENYKLIPLLLLVFCCCNSSNPVIIPEGQLKDGGAYNTAAELRGYFAPKLLNDTIYLGMPMHEFLDICGQPADYLHSKHAKINEVWLIYGDVFHIGQYDTQKYYFAFVDDKLVSWHE